MCKITINGQKSAICTYKGLFCAVHTPTLEINKSQSDTLYAFIIEISMENNLLWHEYKWTDCVDSDGWLNIIYTSCIIIYIWYYIDENANVLICNYK